MSHLAHLRQKIKSIQTTKTITHAVRLVSMSLYNKLDKIDLSLTSYTENVKNLFIDLLDYAPRWENQKLFPNDIFDAMPLYIIVATSKGLCGSLNSNLMRYVTQALFIEKQQKPKFIAIGQKAIAFVKNNELGDLVCSYTELNSNNFIALADDLVDKILHGDEGYSTVGFFSNEAKSFFLQKPHKRTLIPMFLLSSPEHVEASSEEVRDGVQDKLNLDELIWEQEKHEILDYLSVCYLRTSIMHVLFQALRAEHAARFMAMENATNNAEKYLERLTLQFNKLRQSLITREVSELSSSFPIHS